MLYSIEDALLAGNNDLSESFNNECRLWPGTVINSVPFEYEADNTLNSE